MPSSWVPKRANFDLTPGVTGHGSQATGHAQRLKFKRLGPNTNLDCLFHTPTSIHLTGDSNTQSSAEAVTLAML